MDLTLINAPQMVALSNYLSTVVIPPLGTAYLAAFVRKAGYEVKILDAIGSGMKRLSKYRDFYLRGISFDEIVEKINPDTRVIGIGCMFSTQWPSVCDLIKLIKKRHPGIPIILGGEHCTGLPEFCLKKSPADACVLGEGEEALLDLIRFYLTGSPSMENIKGTAFRKSDGSIQIQSERARITAIDDLPRPAWDLIDVEQYIDYNQPHGATKGRSIPMLATRGCPYQCTFCSNASMWTTKWIARNPKAVVDEMEEYMRKYRANDFHFEDLTAIIKKDWVMTFCNEILDRGMKISWQLPSGTRSEAIDLECAIMMKKAGCHHFAYAPESGSMETLQIIRKKVNLDRLFQSARDAMKAEIRVQCFFILGFPHERAKHIWETFKVIFKCAWTGISEVHISAFAPYPNCELFHQLQADGKIPELSDEYFFALYGQDDLLRRKSYNDRISSGMLAVLIWMGYITFFGSYYLMRPHRFISSILGSEDGGGKLAKIIKGTFKNLQDMLRVRVPVKNSQA